jgi:hypothetical protein
MAEEPSRILVTGPRLWRSREIVPAALDEAEGWIRAWVAPSGPLVLVHGCAPGWDTFCAIEAKRRGWTPEGHRVNWRPGGTFDPGAAGNRNQHMVSLGADVAVAGILPCAEDGCTRPQPHTTHGTADCLRRLKRTDIPVLRFGPEGRLPGEVPAELRLR